MLDSHGIAAFVVLAGDQGGRIGQPRQARRDGFPREMPRAKLVSTLGGWVEDFPARWIKPLGLIEVLAAVGLILPPLVGVLPVLSSLAAVCIMIVMVGAIVTLADARSTPTSAST